MALVLKMDAGGAGVDHELGEAHHGRHTAVAGVTVGNNGAEVVDGVGKVVLAPHGLKLLAVVKLLGPEEAVHMLWHRVEGVVGEVGARLIDRRVVGRGLPARHVNGLGKLDHLGELRVVEAPEGGGTAVLVAKVAHELVELAGRQRRGGARPLDGTPEAGDIAGRVVAERALEALARHPLVDLLDASLVRDHVAGSLVGAAHTVGGPNRPGRGRGSEAGGLGVAEARGRHVEGGPRSGLRGGPAVLGVILGGSSGVEFARGEGHGPAPGGDAALRDGQHGSSLVE
mmetsp:Transcript_7841/g.20119  ORF Transcript_7841/g.20119 Transcript_7841/m.20119 type:complete len:285 (-) Transcript_7841:44-898(-)